MPTLDDQRRAAGLNPLPKAVEAEPDEDKPKCQHGCATMPCRHTKTEEKHKKHIDDGLRGVPLVGAGPGVIKGTRPGDSARAIMEEVDAAYEQARLTRSRFKKG